MKYLNLLFISLAIFLNFACQNVKETEVHYQSKTALKFEPKIEGFKIPQLIPDHIQHRKYLTIGNLSFSGEYNWNFIEKSIQHNGKKHGADGYILKKYNEEKKEYSYYVPGHYNYDHFFNSYCYSYNKNGQKKYLYLRRHSPLRYTPGYTKTGTTTIQSIDVDYLVFVDKDSFGYLGFKMTDIENGGVMIDQIIKNSPADKAGLKPKDQIISINGIKFTNQSEYVENVGVLKVGEIHTIQVNRGNEKLTYKCTAVDEEEYIKLVTKETNSH